MPDPARNLKKVFISYRREDSQPIAERIHDYLEKRFPGELFMDTSTGGRTNDWREELKFQSEGCAAMIVIIGAKWVDIRDERGRQRLRKPNDPVRTEIRAALQRHIPLIVVLVNEASMPESVPQGIAQLRRYPRVRVGNNPRFKSDMQLLIKMVDERLPDSAYRTLRALFMKMRPVAEGIGWAIITVALVLLPVLFISYLMPASLDEIIKYFKDKPRALVPHSSSTVSP